MHFVSEYGLFFAKTATLVIAILIVLSAFFGLLFRGKSSTKNQLSIEKMNEKYDEIHESLQETILSKKAFKAWRKEMKKAGKQKEKELENKRRVFVLDFIGDMRASAVENLREEITAVLSSATPKDEVVVRLESPGGVVPNYGFAASQLERIREKNIPLTITVDKVAASGGYLMACVANKILAAPFAIIGSIGVVGQIPNFHRLLKKKDIDFEQITAGEYKRTLSIFGENTEKGREKFREEIQEIHHYFKQHIERNRPEVNVSEIATGEIWLASKAITLKLVDELMTSDDYLFTLANTVDIFHVHYQEKKSLLKRLTHSAQAIWANMKSEETEYLFK